MPKTSERGFALIDKKIGLLALSELWELRFFGKTGTSGSEEKREKYKIYKSTTERYLDSPLNAMRRKLNELASMPI